MIKKQDKSNFYKNQADFSKKYELKANKNGVYAFVINGEVEVAGQKLSPRDGLGIWNTDSFDIKTSTDTKLLLMEVPMAA